MNDRSSKSITESTPIDSSTRRAVRRRLLDWFSSRKRDLPWRGTTDPYAVLVSEIMLQQTQVETVIPYYERFMEKFPDFESLAKAPEAEVLRFWAGLGYYRRARSLHSCSKRVVGEFAGRLPEGKEAVLSLPGIGPYTAGAILSIAHGQPEPLVDGNVERVLSRFFALDLDLASSAGKKEIWRTAACLVPEDRPGDFNQALMELGATICKPTSPGCIACPLSSMCRAHRDGRETDFPVKSKNLRKDEIEEVVLLVRRGRKWLLTDSNQHSLYPGLWQFPWAWKSETDCDLSSVVQRLASGIGLAAESLEPFRQTHHSVTFRRIETYCFLSSSAERVEELKANSGGWAWLSLREIGRLGLPSYQKRLVEALHTL